MPSINRLTLAALTVVSASAVDIQFRRFAQAGCDEAMNHIRKDVYLHEDACKTFLDTEPAYYSFQVLPEDNVDEAQNQMCTVTVWAERACAGASWNANDMYNFFGSCVDIPFPGRSVSVDCFPRLTHTGGEVASPLDGPMAFPAADDTEQMGVAEAHAAGDGPDVWIFTEPLAGPRTTLLTTTTAHHDPTGVLSTHTDRAIHTHERVHVDRVKGEEPAAATVTKDTTGAKPLPAGVVKSHAHSHMKTVTLGLDEPSASRATEGCSGGKKHGKRGDAEAEAADC